MSEIDTNNNPHQEQQRQQHGNLEQRTEPPDGRDTATEPMTPPRHDYQELSRQPGLHVLPTPDLEVLPPSDLEVRHTTEDLQVLEPSSLEVVPGAGGGTTGWAWEKTPNASSEYGVVSPETAYGGANGNGNGNAAPPYALPNPYPYPYPYPAARMDEQKESTPLAGAAAVSGWGDGDGDGQAERRIAGMKRNTFLVVVALVALLVVVAVAVGVGVGVALGRGNNNGSQNAAATGSTTRRPFPLPTAQATITPARDIECPADNLTLYTPSTGAPRRYTLLCGRDYNSGAGTVDLYNEGADTMAECIDLCAAEDACVGAGWGLYQGRSVCWLKSFLATPQDSALWYFAALDDVAPDGLPVVKRGVPARLAPTRVVLEA